MNGVPSVGQYPIAPGSSFTYKFRADRFGSSWYHSHYSALYAGGLLGPMLIHGPSHVKYDVDLGPAFISDWYHKEYFQLLSELMETDPSLRGQFSQNNLINGKGNFSCSKALDSTRPCSNDAPNAKFCFQPGKVHRLRLVNAGAQGFEYFQIDGHEMTIIANDFVPIKPYTTKVLSCGIGQRADVLVKAIGKPNDSYWMCANNSCICGQTKKGDALAEIHYESANVNVPPRTDAWPFVDRGTCNNEELTATEPYYAVPALRQPTVTQIFNIDRGINATGHQEWYVNNVSFHGNYNNQLLEQTYDKNLTFADEWVVYNFGKNSSVRLVINNLTTFETRLSHPMHLHGHDFFVIADGRGTWDGSTLVRPENPMRRDTQLLRRGGYTVIEFETDNPGIWPFHCYIAWHVSESLYVRIMELPQDIKQKEIPKVMKDTCKAWNKWSANNVVAQIDSGLRLAMEKEGLGRLALVKARSIASMHCSGVLSFHR